MAEVAICSLVRDGMAYLPSYRRQLECLQLPAGDTWRLHILEGDSQDGSQEFLRQWADEDPRIQIGQEHVGDAVEQEDRAGRWARVGNACFQLIPPESSHSHVLWLEADLCFPPELLARLLAREVDIVAPMIYLGGVFYDTWGFRDTNGRRWTNTTPFHPDYKPFSLMEMGSVGSCVLFRREVLDAGIRFKGTYENGLLVGMCNDARVKGFRVFADTATAILHPMGPWEAQMWRPSRVEVQSSGGSVTSLRLQEAVSLGLQPNLPILDPSAFVSAQLPFLRNLFRKYKAARIELAIGASTYPQKTYFLQVLLGPPSGFSHAGPFWNWILKSIGPRRTKFHLEQDGSSIATWAFGRLKSRTRITLETRP